MATVTERDRDLLNQLGFSPSNTVALQAIASSREKVCAEAVEAEKKLRDVVFQMKHSRLIAQLEASEAARAKAEAERDSLSAHLDKALARAGTAETKACAAESRLRRIKEAADRLATIADFGPAHDMTLDEAIAAYRRACEEGDRD